MQFIGRAVALHLVRATLRTPSLIFSFIIVTAIFLLYSVAFGHNFLFDEESIIVRNPAIRDLSQAFNIFKQPYFYSGLPRISWAQYYRPLTTLTFAIDYHFWGLSPLGYNLVNTLLHCGVCVLLFKLLSMMLEDDLAAFLAAFLYSVHTIHTEAVTYIASRGDVLGTFLVLLSLLLYWKSRRFAALLAHVLALFAKESAILLPIYIVLLEFAFIKSDLKIFLKRTAPFILLNVSYIAFRKFICPVPLGPPSNDWGEALLRVLSMGHPFLSYLQAVFFPEVFKYGLTVNFAKSFSDPQVFLTCGIVALLLTGWALTLKYRGAAFFGMSVFLVSFLPYLQIIHFYPEWAEHYLYVPGIGLTILLGCLLREIFRGGHRRLFTLFLAFYLPFVGFLCYRTYERNQIYNDSETYFEYLSKSGARYAHYGYQNLGRMAMEAGEPGKAVVLLKTAESMEPDCDETQNFLGLYYLQKGNLKESLKHFDLAYKYNKVNEVYRINASFVLIRMGKYQEVIDTLEKVQKIIPEYSSVYINLLAANEILGRVEAAKLWGEKGLVILQKNEWEEVTLLMAMARMAYREGWESVARSRFTEIVERHAKVFWYSDVARLVLGKISTEQFLKLVEWRYFGYENTAQGYLLMSLVMQKRWEEVEKFLEKNKLIIDKQTAKQPLLSLQIEQAREGVRLFRARVTA